MKNQIFPFPISGLLIVLLIGCSVEGPERAAPPPLEDGIYSLAEIADRVFESVGSDEIAETGYVCFGAAVLGTESYEYDILKPPICSRSEYYSVIQSSENFTEVYEHYKRAKRADYDLIPTSSVLYDAQCQSANVAVFYPWNEPIHNSSMILQPGCYSASELMLKCNDGRCNYHEGIISE